ncbi:hypothetical protein BGZ83_002013 [Gryganskiella cystojenkinii]|nr:hypothetical protein BGZ83_002013 [Gryganskiella cystojenkinii]
MDGRQQSDDDDSEEGRSSSSRGHDPDRQGHDNGALSIAPVSSTGTSKGPVDQDKAYKSNSMSISSLLGVSSSAAFENNGGVDSGRQAGVPFSPYTADDGRSGYSPSRERVESGTRDGEYNRPGGHPIEGQSAERVQLHRHSHRDGRHRAPGTVAGAVSELGGEAYGKYRELESRQPGHEAAQDLERNMLEESQMSDSTTHSGRLHGHHHNHHDHNAFQHPTLSTSAPPHVHMHGHHHHHHRHSQPHIVHQHQHQHQHRIKTGGHQHQHHHQHHHHQHQQGDGTPPSRTSAFSYVPKALGLSLNPRLKVNATQVYISYLIQLDQMQRAQHLMRSSEKRKSMQDPTSNQVDVDAPPHKQHQGAHIRSLSSSETTKAAQVVPRRETAEGGDRAASPIPEAIVEPTARRSRSIDTPDIPIDEASIGGSRSPSASRQPPPPLETHSPRTHARIHSHGHPAHTHAHAHHHHHHPHSHLHPHGHPHGYVHGHAHGHLYPHHAHPHMHPHPHPHPHAHPHAHPHVHPHPHTAPVLPAHIHPPQHHHHVVPTKTEQGSSSARGSTSPNVHRHHGAHHHHHPHHHPYHPNHPNHQHHFHHHTHPTGHVHGHGRGGHAYPQMHGHNHSRHVHAHSHNPGSHTHIHGYSSRSQSSLPDESRSGSRGPSYAHDQSSMSPPHRHQPAREGSSATEDVERPTATKAAQEHPSFDQNSLSPHQGSNGHSPEQPAKRASSSSGRSSPTVPRSDE